MSLYVFVEFFFPLFSLPAETRERESTHGKRFFFHKAFPELLRPVFPSWQLPYNVKNTKVVDYSLLLVDFKQ